MNLRDLGVEHKVAGGKVWINPAESPVKAELVISALKVIQPRDETAEERQDHLVNNVRQAFIMIEGYVLDSEFEDVTFPFGRYLDLRQGKSLEERWDLFGHIMNYTDCLAVFEMHDATRPKDMKVDIDNTPLVEPPAKKKSSKSPMPIPKETVSETA